MKQQLLDVAIIGGGPAGLSAALTLGRAMKRVAVIDAGRPRNAVTREMHGFLTRDSISPRLFRRMAKEEMGAYPSVSFVEDEVVAVAGADGGFRLETAQGAVYGSRKLLFAVGMKDRPLNIPGLDEAYGISAFICPYCDGWELRERPLVIINRGTDLLHFAPLIAGWSQQLAACTNGPDELTEAGREELRRHSVPVFDSPIRSIDSVEGMVRQVVLEDGNRLPCEGIFFKPRLATGSDLPRMIGCRVAETGTIEVDEAGRTTVPGVYSAGDAASHQHQAMAAAALGLYAATALNHELNSEAWKRAVQRM